MRRPAQPVTERPGGTPDVGDSGGAIDVRRQCEIDVRVRLDPVQRLADMKKEEIKEGRRDVRGRYEKKERKKKKQQAIRRADGWTDETMDRETDDEQKKILLTPFLLVEI